jgi:hypothetical protein
MGRNRRPRGLRAMEAAARRYLEECGAREKLPTVTGLALALGFTSRAAMERFSKEQGGKFAALLDWARSLIEEETLQAVYRKETATGARFILQSSFGYGEKERPDLGPITVQVEGEEQEEGEPCG